VLICWDQWFPEAARVLALAGAEIVIYPSAIGSLAGEKAEERRKQISAWEVIHRAHAIANGIFVAAANRVGREGRIQFWGRSFAAGPFGEVLARAGESREEIVIAKCNLTEIQRIRKDWPFLKEHRHRFPSPLVRQKADESVLWRTGEGKDGG
jgi:N-carbamoylputrescine amidase